MHYTKCIAASNSSLSKQFVSAILCNRAAARMGAQKYIDAMLDCGRAIILDPTLSAKRTRRAAIFSHLRLFDKSLEDLNMYEKTADANGDVKQKNDAKSRAKELKAVEIKLEQQYGESAPIHARHTRFLRRLVHHISERQRHHESVQKVILARARGQSLPPERAPEPFRRRERGRAQTAHRRRKQSFQPSQRRERRVKNLRRPTFPRRL